MTAPRLALDAAFPLGKCVTCAAMVSPHVYQCRACINSRGHLCIECGTATAQPGEPRCQPCFTSIGLLPCARCAEPTWVRVWRMCPDCARVVNRCEECGTRRPSGMQRVCRVCVTARQVAEHGDPGALGPAARRRVFDGQECVYCGYPAETVDHVKPLSRGGRNDPANLVPACRSCNSCKGTCTLDEWFRSRPDAHRNIMRAATVSASIRAELRRVGIKYRAVPRTRFAGPTRRCGWKGCGEQTARTVMAQYAVDGHLWPYHSCDDHADALLADFCARGITCAESAPVFPVP